MNRYKNFASKYIIFSLFAIYPFLGTFPQIAPETSRVIVTYQENVSDSARNAALGSLSDKKIKRLSFALPADVLSGVTDSEISKLKSDPRVVRVEKDAIATILDFPITKTALKKNQVNAQSQILPWGIDKIDAELVWPLGNQANPIKVGVIDTGISNTHPELTPNIKGGVNTIRPRRSWNDDNGHGSHVAGIIAAVNNTSGVVGVAPSADLYAIKVLNSSGSGYVSDIIEGLDWSIANKMQLVNMSLGTTADIQSFHDAVTRAYNAGIIEVAAAGNDGSAVIYPAAYPEVVAVTATDQTDTIASWSSRGPEVDFAAPGVNIYSTYKDTGYATLSGTSMAAPHVTGALALILNSPVGAFDANGNGKWDFSEAEEKLKAGAVDLGTAGFDNLYGWGLINIFNSLK